MTEQTELTLSDVIKIGFKVSKKGDKLNDEMMRRLGGTKRYLPARLAIAYAIHKDTMLPPKSSGGGNVIKGNFLFGGDVEILCWVALIQAAFPETKLTTAKSYENAVSALWESGLNHLNDLWRGSGENRAEFIKRLAEMSGVGAVASIHSSTSFDDIESQNRKATEAIQDSARKVSLTIGKISQNVKTGEVVSWEPNRDGESPVLALLGSMGKGKTETAFQMIEQIRDQSNATFLIFDVKGDLSNSTRTRQTGATIIDCYDKSIPLDAFTPSSTTDKDMKRAALEFRDTFVQIRKEGMGANQLKHCYEAAYRTMKLKKSHVTLQSIRDQLDNYYEEENLKRDGLWLTMDELCAFEYFTPKQSPDDFFSKSWILDIHKLSPSGKNLITDFVIDALWNWYAKQDDSPKSGSYRALRNVLVVDEARELLKRGQKSLINLIRQSRSKGGVTIFMSQSPDDFDVKQEDYLTNIGLVVAFSTGAGPTSLKRVLGEKVDLGGLESGHCYTRLVAHSKRPMKVKVW